MINLIVTRALGKAVVVQSEMLLNTYKHERISRKGAKAQRG